MSDPRDVGVGEGGGQTEGAMKRPVTGWKVVTHDLRPPVQGGSPLWNGSLPLELDKVKLDTSEAECAAGWNFCDRLEDAFRIAGLWPTGRPSRAFLVEPLGEIVTRAKKARAESLRIVREATAAEIETALMEFSHQHLQAHATEMAREQMLWRQALARPQHDPAAVEDALLEALTGRDLKWKLKKFESAGAAWDAWVADAWAAGAASTAWGAGAARAAAAAWAAGDAWDAWTALIVYFASRQGWLSVEADLLTRGIRDAYFFGLEVAIPTGPSELGWAMNVSRTVPNGTMPSSQPRKW